MTSRRKRNSLQIQVPALRQPLWTKTASYDDARSRVGRRMSCSVFDTNSLGEGRRLAALRSIYPVYITPLPESLLRRTIYERSLRAPACLTERRTARGL